MGSSRDVDDNNIPYDVHDMGDMRSEDASLERDGDSELDDEGSAMPEAESVEQYVRLHEHIERLRADRAPLRPDKLTADEAQTYQMAAFFRAAAPGATDLDAIFVANLRKRLEHEATSARRGVGADVSQPTVRTVRRATRQRPEITRRGLLGVGLGAAAAFIGAAAGAAVERELEGQGGGVVFPSHVAIVPDERGIWVAVAAVDELPVGSVRRFATESMVGFVRHTMEGFSALSGVCTHMGCLLLWNAGARTYDCPCHGGRFMEDGSSAATSPVVYSPLPAVATKVEDGHVWVYTARPVVASPGTGTIPPYSNAGGTPGASASPKPDDSWSH